MIEESDIDYLRRREEDCRRMAREASEGWIRKRHLELADAFAARAARLSGGR